MLFLLQPEGIKSCKNTETYLEDHLHSVHAIIAYGRRMGPPLSIERWSR